MVGGKSFRIKDYGLIFTGFYSQEIILVPFYYRIILRGALAAAWVEILYSFLSLTPLTRDNN